MPFNVPIGEMDSSVAQGMMGMVGQMQARHNQQLQIQLADLEARKMAMNINAQEAAQRFSMAQEQMDEEKKYRDAKLAADSFSQAQIGNRFAMTLQDRQQAREDSSADKTIQMQEIAARHQDSVAATEARLKLSQSIENRRSTDSVIRRSDREGEAQAKQKRIAYSLQYRTLKEQNAADVKRITDLNRELAFADPQEQADRKHEMSVLQRGINARKSQINTITNAYFQQGGDVSEGDGEDPSGHSLPMPSYPNDPLTVDNADSSAEVSSNADSDPLGLYN